MKKRIAASIFALGLTLGAAEQHTVTLDKPAVIAGQKVKAGEYKLELNGDKATLKNGKTTVETNVKVEDAASKYQKTSACCLAADGQYKLQELRIGGTGKKLTFKDKSQTAEAGN